MAKIKNCLEELGFRPNFCDCVACKKSWREYCKRVCNNPPILPLKPSKIITKDIK